MNSASTASISGEFSGLDAWKQQVAREDLKRIANKDTNDLFQKLVNSDKELIALLDHREPTLKLPVTEETNDIFEGKHDPTFLIMAKKFQNAPLEIPINGRKAFQATTDAVNDFFIRANNRGYLDISKTQVRERFSVKHILYNGRLTVFLNPADESLRPGDVFKFQIGLNSESMPAALTQPVSIKLLSAVKKVPNPPRPPKPPKPPPGEKPNRSLPPYVLLTKDGRDVLNQPTKHWPEGFSELDGGRITGDDNKPIYEINVDNAYHLRYRYRVKSDAART